MKQHREKEIRVHGPRLVKITVVKWLQTRLGAPDSRRSFVTTRPHEKLLCCGTKAVDVGSSPALALHLSGHKFEGVPGIGGWSWVSAWYCPVSSHRNAGRRRISEVFLNTA